MLRICPEKNPKLRVDRRDKQVGDFTEIVILSEEDLKNIDSVMCGIACDLVVVPRKLTEKEERVINISISNGLTVFGKILRLK